MQRGREYGYKTATRRIPVVMELFYIYTCDKIA